jgi:hypothetical protein
VGLVTASDRRAGERTGGRISAYCEPTDRVVGEAPILCRQERRGSRVVRSDYASARGHASRCRAALRIGIRRDRRGKPRARSVATGRERQSVDPGAVRTAAGAAAGSGHQSRRHAAVLFSGQGKRRRGCHLSHRYRPGRASDSQRGNANRPKDQKPDLVSDKEHPRRPPPLGGSLAGRSAAWIREPPWANTHCT